MSLWWQMLVTARRACDPCCCGQDFALWNHVWVYWPTHKKDLLPKLSKQWVGLCKVLEQVLDMVYHTIGKWQAVALHQDQLAPYWALATLWDEAMENTGGHGSGPGPYHHPLICFISPSISAGHLGDSRTSYCALGCSSCHVSRTVACGSTNLHLWLWNCWQHYASCLTEYLSSWPSLYLANCDQLFSCNVF